MTKLEKILMVALASAATAYIVTITKIAKQGERDIEAKEDIRKRVEELRDELAREASDFENGES